MSQPVTLWRLLNADQGQVLAEVQEQLGRLAAKIVLVHLAVKRRGGRDLTEARLERLATSLQEAAQDARSAQRSWASGR